MVLTRLGKIADRSAAGGDRPLGATEGHRQPPDVEKILGASRDQVKPIEPGGRQAHPLDQIRISASPTDAGRDAIRRRVDRYCTGAFAFACPFMEATGDMVMAWMLLWRATVARERIVAGAKKKDRAFYDGQLRSAQFFINTQLPVTMGKMEAILTDDDAVTAIAEEAFGGK